MTRLRPTFAFALASITVVPFLVTALVACGGDARPADAPTSGANGADGGDGVVRPITNGQLTVAHFATRDGTQGLVLDRTGGGYKYRMDGAKDVVELTPLEDRHFGERRGFYLQSPDGRNVLYLGVNGDLALFTKTDQLPLNSDNPADKLPAATITGAPKHVASVSEVYQAKLTALSVVTRFPDLKDKDASNLEKVRDALTRAPAAMAVHYVAQAKDAWVPHIEWTPGNQGVGFGGGAWTSSTPFDPTVKSGLGKYGGVVKGYSEYDSQGNHLFAQTLAGYPPALPAGTPGLVWNVDGGTAYFVTFDGARYRVDVSEETVKAGEPLAAGSGSAGSWPPPLTESFMGVTEVTGLAKVGAMPQANAALVLADDDAWNTCAQKTWKKLGAERDRVKSDRQLEALNDRVRATCKAPRDKMSADLTRIIEERNAARLKLYSDAKAKFGG
jgi:hypothetical protein